MGSFIRLVGENLLLIPVIGLADIMLAVLLARRIRLSVSKRVADARGIRSIGKSAFKQCSTFAFQGVTILGRCFENGAMYRKARFKLRKAGYSKQSAVVWFLLIRFALSPVIFLAAFALNFPDLLRPTACVVLINTVMETVISAQKRKVNLRFQKVTYKIYKYLYNQISSGVKPTDAVRSVYEATEDNELKSILIRLAARYELTLDIDSALEEFKANFDVHEAETLCIALKQGVDTGDNKELLARQENVMFKKYFNTLQAETESCRNRSIAAAAVFVAIIVIMIVVPMLNEVNMAIEKIFIN